MATSARLSCTLSLESTLNTAIMWYRNLPPCYERFSDASGLAEVVCALCCCSYSVLSVTGIKSRCRALLLSRSRENLAMSRVLRLCLQADHRECLAECLLITKLQLVASCRLIIFILIVFPLFSSSGQALASL